MRKTKRKHKVCKENFYLLRLLAPLMDLTFEEYVAFCDEDPNCCDLCSPTAKSPIGSGYIDDYMFNVPNPTRQKYLAEMIGFAKEFLREIKQRSPDFDLFAQD